MSCTQGREHTLYAVQTTRDQAEVGVDYLTDSVSNSVYKPWEVERSLPRLKLDLATRSPATQALELLHQAAFRTGLGNSLYSPGHKVGSHGTAVINQFVSKHFTSGRAAILGVGISHQALTKVCTGCLKNTPKDVELKGQICDIQCTGCLKNTIKSLSNNIMI